ncbi:MAG: hypothetical protein E7046_14385, partial [Lentisphaerae bacterium]|nr:hypothetical protein [Lentisphaerota bacterium]
MNESCPKTTDRIPIIDAAKGYGILLVFLGHLVYYDSPLFRVIFNFHMPLFFLLSGMTFSPEKDANCKAILKRLWNTIGIPFAFFTLLGTLVCAFTGRLMQHSLMDWLRAGASFFHGDPYVGGSLWFLTCLAVVKFIFWAWSKKPHSVRWNVGMIIAAYIVGCVFGNFVNPKILLGGPLMCFSVPMAFFFFAIGYYCRGVLPMIQESRHVGLLALSVLCLVVEIVLALLYPTPNMAIPAFPSPHTFLPASLCGISAILCLSGKSFAAIRFIGRYSLYYFLMERWAREAWFAIADRLVPGFA